jgi:hypothetical protein
MQVVDTSETSVSTYETTPDSSVFHYSNTTENSHFLRNSYRALDNILNACIWETTEAVNISSGAVPVRYTDTQKNE